MAAENTTVIEIIAQVSDRTQPEAAQAEKSVSQMEKAMKKAQETADGLKKTSKIELAVSAIDKASAVINNVTKLGKQLTGKVWEITLKAKDLLTAPLRGVKSILGGIMNPILSGIGMSAGMGLSSMITEAITSAGRVQTGNIAMNAVARSTDTNIDLLTQQKKAVMNLGIAEQEATGIMTKFMQAQLDVAQASKIARVAQDAAVISGTNSSEAAATMVDAISSLNPILLKQFGMTKSQTTIYNDYAEAQGLIVRTTDKYGKSVRHLTRELDDAEKKQAMLNYVLSQGEKIAGAYEDAMESPFKKLGSLPRYVTTFFQTIGTPLFLPIFGRAVDAVTNLFKKGTEWAKANNNMLERWGAQAAEWFDSAAKKLDSFIGKVKETIGSEEFQNADLFGKIGILWDDIIAKPFSEWWEGKGKAWLNEKAGEIGKGLGTALRAGIMGLIGILGGDGANVANDAFGIGKTFGEAFAEGFEASDTIPRLLDAIWKGITGFAKAHPMITALFLGPKALSLAMSGLKSAGTIKAIFGGLGSFMSGVKIYAAANAANAGNAAQSALTFANAGTLGAGVKMGAAAIPAAAMAGTAIAGFQYFKGMNELFQAYKEDDKARKEMLAKSGGARLGGVAVGAATGAAIGSVVPVLGTGIGALIGAGVGGLAGSFAAGKIKEQYDRQMEEADKAQAAAFLAEQQAKFSSQALKNALADANISAEEFGQRFDREVINRLKDRFGSIQLSLTDIKDIAQRLTFGETADGLAKLAAATKDVNSSLNDLNTITQDINKLNWKADAGLWNTNDVDAYKTAVQNAIDKQKEFIMNTAYQTHTAFSVFGGPNITSDPNQTRDLTEYSNKMYSQFIDQISANEKEMQSILSQGNIADSDRQRLNELGQQNQGITDTIQGAQNRASFDLIATKAGGAGLTYDSFSALQNELMAQREAAMQQLDDAYKKSVTAIEVNTEPDFNKSLALSDVQGAYQEALGRIDKNLSDLLWNTVDSIFGNEDFLQGLNLPGDTTDRLKTAVIAAIQSGVDVGSWSEDIWRKFLIGRGIPENTSMELAGEVKQLLSPMAAIYENQGTTQGTTLADSMSKAFSDNIKFSDNNKLAQFIKNLQSIADQSKIQIQTEIVNPVDNTGGHGYQGPAITPSPPPSAAASAPSSQTSHTSQTSGSSAGISLPPGLKPSAEGGIFTSPQYRLFAEDGAEAIIPLTKRDRGMSLWRQAGKMLGAKPYSPIPAIAAGETGGSYGVVPVTIDNISFEVNVDGGNPDGIINDIRAGIKDLADDVANEISFSLKQTLANMPMAVGDVF